MKRRSVAMTATAGAAAGALGLGFLAMPTAGADPNLPPVSPEKLVSSVMKADTPALAGTVRVDNNLGMPAIPGMRGSAGQMLSGGTSTFRVWTDGNEHQRVSLPSEGGETTIVNDGTTVWKWKSAERTVTKSPAHGERAEKRAQEHQREMRRDPGTTAKQAIAKLRESSTVSVDGTASVAGRDAYELVLTPKPTERTVLREVRIAVGAEKRTPLRVVVNTNGSDDPALSVGFSKLDVGPQPAELFQFTPPAGAEVKRAEKHERPEGERPKQSAKPEMRTVGKGWDTVVLARVPQEALKPREQGSEQESQGPSSLRGFAQRAGERVSGPWGQGWIISTRAGSALLTSDGRVAAGAVPQQVLTDAIGTPR